MASATEAATVTGRRIGAVLCLAAVMAALVLPGRWYLVSFAPFAGGAWLVARLDRRTALALVLLGGVLLPLTAAMSPPASSDDLYRYLWDGRVQLADVDPYRYPPAAPELAPLRDGPLWSPDAHWCLPDGACTRINRPTVPTIYPPVAEGLFAAVAALAPGVRGLQLVMAMFAAAVGALLWRALAALGRDPRRAVLWAWCPMVALEAGNNAHVDVVAVGLAAVAVWLLARGRAVPGGLAWGLAIATKLTPALLAPALLRRRPLAVGLAAVGAVAAVYLPHVLAVGPGVLGYLPGYLHEEGYTDGSRFALLSAVLPAALTTPAAAAIVAVAAVAVWWRADPDRPWRAAAAMVTVTLLVAAPAYPWYALLLVMLVAYGAPWEWLTVAAAAYLAQFAPDLGLATATAQRIGYGTALAVVAAGLAARSIQRHLSTHSVTRDEQPDPSGMMAP
ncbi:glycosyltransferase 87 family protein [Dactylosporangium sp. NPDC051541]|uniref:glycosyltransferase 87 family protein n=1 Tax=Dactylosporangium sp. NPDC051541 TaxID=3363977 RepID=UPI0037B7F9BC